MKEKIVFATHNKHKLREVSSLLADKYNVIGLEDLGCYEDIPETADTFEGNALLKSSYVFEKYGYSCFSDDSGLEVSSLNNAPGVLSARYAGVDHDDEANNRKLLHELSDKTDRTAKFRTVISLILNGEKYYFQGEVTGQITLEPRGKAGFGYDPLFQPDGFEETFAELGDSIKNKISHRARAIQKLIEFLQNNR